MAPISWEEESTLTEFNSEGTPVSEISSHSEPSSTPVVTNGMQTQMLSALIFEFDSADSAAKGLELFNAEQIEQISRDPRSPATNEFSPDDLGDAAYGHEGVYEAEVLNGDPTELAIVYLLVQDDNLVYQVFGQFVPGNHVELATEVAEQMITADASDEPPAFDMNGQSTGGLWEKLNAVEIVMPDESTVADLEIYPTADDAVTGDSVTVPTVDLDNLAAIPGAQGSWHVAYGPGDIGTPMATPDSLPPGVFNIELWVMDFSDATASTAAAFSLNDALVEPLGIISTEGGGFDTEGSQRITMVNSGFVRDRSMPEGDAAVVIVVDGTTVYAARVYANGPAPTPIATDLVESMITAEPGDQPEATNGTTFSGGTWERFPQAGSELLHGLEPILVRHDDPSPAPEATPAG